MATKCVTTTLSSAMLRKASTTERRHACCSAGHAAHGVDSSRLSQAARSARSSTGARISPTAGSTLALRADDDRERAEGGERLGGRFGLRPPPVAEAGVAVGAPAGGRLAVADEDQPRRRRHATPSSRSVSTVPDGASRRMYHSVPKAASKAGGGMARKNDVSEIWLA